MFFNTIKIQSFLITWKKARRNG